MQQVLDGSSISLCLDTGICSSVGPIPPSWHDSPGRIAHLPEGRRLDDCGGCSPASSTTARP